MLNNQRLRYFYKTVQYQGIRAAAEALNIAPSVISRQIALLEKELDIPLLERGMRGAVPTEAGEKVVTFYMKQQEAENTLKDDIFLLKGMHTGKIILATGVGYLPIVEKVITSFSKQFPGIHIKLTTANSNEIISKVADNKAHIGIIFNPPSHPSIRVHKEFTHPLKLFCNRQSPLVNSSMVPISFKELINERVALPDHAHGIRQIIQRAEQEEEIYFQPSLICNHLQLLKQYTLTGGITFLPAFMLTDEDKALIDALELQQSFLNQTKTQIISRRGRNLTPATQLLLKEIIKVMPEQ
ncbi:LysR family transcriptional regulator [Pelistega indica]|uniref:LysR family transcriptional regulator n=1 Tax=Pelistega indica TaxID=1414851 RepID=V8G8C3_9BURK|nr:MULTISPECIES: LysR family transcriptional regulator [Pelistega]ETD72203.1 LysR family transcriptional regulator [Pelistega indica]